MMDDKTRGDDAADHAPRPDSGAPSPGKPAKQDAPNYDKTEDEGRAIPTGDLTSANDE